MNWNEQSVVVTGGLGFIGSHLVNRLSALGVGNGPSCVYIVDDLSRGRKENVGSLSDKILLQQDIARKWEGLSALWGDKIVFHLAAKVTGIHYNRTHHLDMMQSNMDINSGLVRGILKGREKPKLLIWVSTACVYPHDAPVPTPEDCATVCDPEPTNFGYGVAKWVGEQQARFLCREHGIPTIIVRFFNAFGVRDYYDEATSHVAPALIRRVMEGENPLIVWGSGKQTRALVDAADIAKALTGLAERVDETLDQLAVRACYCPTEPGGISVPDDDVRRSYNRMVSSGFPWVVNIGHTREISISDLAHTIVNMATEIYDIPKPEIVFDTSKPDGYPRRAADTTLLKYIIDWVPDTPIEDTLYVMLEDYLNQRRMGWTDD